VHFEIIEFGYQKTVFGNYFVVVIILK